MKSIQSMFLVSMALFASLAMSAQTNNNHVMLRLDGLFGSISMSTGGSTLNIDVSRTGNSGQDQTFLSFDNFVETEDGFTDTTGFGMVPNDSLQGGDTARLVFDLNLSQLPDFSASTCTFTFATAIETCGPAPLGAIHLEWRQNKQITSHQITDGERTFFQTQIHLHQAADSSSAGVTGSFSGIDVSTGVGEVGINHNSTIEIFKSH